MTNTSATNQRRGMILLADVIFLFAIFFITRTAELGWLDVLMIGLVVISLILLAYDQFARPAGGLGTMLGAAQTAIAATVSLRFLVLFIGDMDALASLFLYGAIIIFFFVAVTGVISLVMNRNTASGDVADIPDEPDPVSTIEETDTASPEVEDVPAAEPALEPEQKL